MTPFDPDKPNNDLPPLPLKAELESKAVLRKTIAANRALAEVKRAEELVPNQSVLIHTTGLQEAKLSSAIENVVTQAYIHETNTSLGYAEKS